MLITYLYNVHVICKQLHLTSAWKVLDYLIVGHTYLFHPGVLIGRSGAPAVLWHPKCWSADVRGSDATGFIPASVSTGRIIWSHSVYCELNMLLTRVIRFDPLTLHTTLQRYLQLTVTEETCKPSHVKLSVGWNKRGQRIRWHNVWLFISICIDRSDQQSLILQWLLELCFTDTFSLFSDVFLLLIDDVRIDWCWFVPIHYQTRRKYFLICWNQHQQSEKT